MKAYLSLKIYVLAGLLTLLFSCKDKLEPATNGTNGAGDAKFHRYFPLSQGRYIVYDVDSIVHGEADDNTTTPDALKTHYHFQLKEIIDSSFNDGQGKKAWYVSRYKRPDDSVAWEFQNICVEQADNYSAQRVEDNFRYIKLSFPIFKNKIWNGNAYNTLSEEDYTYTEANTPLSIGGFTFDSSATVIQNKNFNLIYNVLKQEKYATGVGMVFKEKDSLNLNALLDTTNGYEYRMTLKDYFPK